MYSFLKATFWISFLWSLKKNSRQLTYLLIWTLGFFLTDYFFSEFKSIINDENSVLIAFIIKMLLQLIFVAFFLFDIKKMLFNRQQIENDVKTTEGPVPFCTTNKKLSRSEPMTLGKTKKQRIIEKYTTEKPSVQQSEGEKHGRTDQ